MLKMKKKKGKIKDKELILKTLNCIKDIIENNEEFIIEIRHVSKCNVFKLDGRR